MNGPSASTSSTVTRPIRSTASSQPAQYALLPLFFGLPQAEVVEETCQCRGDANCMFRIRWDEVDPAQSRVEYLEMRTQVLEARLEQLQDMVTDLASNERYEDVLQGIVASSMRSVGASGALLALEPGTGALRRIYSEGLTGAEAEAMAAELLAGTVPGKAAAVEVVSARRRYGVLAIGEQGGLFNSQSQNTLDDVRPVGGRHPRCRRCHGPGAAPGQHGAGLLELSTSLSELVSPAEMAAKVARAVPAVIECDCAAVFLDDGDWHDDRRHQIPPRGVLRLLRRDDGGAQRAALPRGCRPTRCTKWASPFVVARRRRRTNDLGPDNRVWQDHRCGHGRRDGRPRTAGHHAADRRSPQGPGRPGLHRDQQCPLVEQIRFQAMHDTLTGLPNRALILDRTEQMLARARRTYVPVAALFIDLDGFKEVNDTLGHAVGDELLQAVTARLAGIMRESDSVGRLGGDEFVVLVDGSTMDAGPELVAERLLAVLRAALRTGGHAVRPARA